MVISLAQTLLSCAKFRPLRVIKKDIILLTLDLLWGRPQALLQRRNVSSVRVGLANGTKRTPSQNWGNLLSELHVPHRQCLAGISNAFFASLTVSGHLSLGFTVPPTKRAYSALYPQALTECSPLDFRRSSIVTRSQMFLKLSVLVVSVTRSQL